MNADTLVENAIGMRSTETIDTALSPEEVAAAIARGLVREPGLYRGGSSPEGFALEAVYFSKGTRPRAQARVERLAAGSRLHLEVRPLSKDMPAVLALVVLVIAVIPATFLGVAVTKGVFAALQMFPLVIIAGGGLFFGRLGFVTEVKMLRDFLHRSLNAPPEAR